MIASWRGLKIRVSEDQGQTPNGQRASDGQAETGRTRRSTTDEAAVTDEVRTLTPILCMAMRRGGRA